MIYNIQHSKIKPKLLSIICCYILISIGIYYFIIKDKKKPIDAFFLGILVYGVYDITNYALFDNWKLEILIIDILWGGILLYLITFIYYKIKKIFYK